MLYLAQVKKKNTSEKMELELLAHQVSETVWEVIPVKSLPFPIHNFLGNGVLVLVEVSEENQIINLKEAKDWILEILQKYFIHPQITPEFLQEEKNRIETWRQEITSQSLDLTRRYLELETQRDQLQDLDAKLQQDKKNLEARWQELEHLQLKLETEKEHLEDDKKTLS